MTAWFHNDRALVRALRRDILKHGWVRDSVVGTGIFNANGVELGVTVDWADEDRLTVSDGSEAWGALWMSNHVRARLSSADRSRFERVAASFGVTFNSETKAFETTVHPSGFADAAKRVASVSLVVDGWRFVMEPLRRGDDPAQAGRVLDRVSRLGEKREWVTKEHVEVPLTGDERSWTARAALVRKNASVALVTLSDEASEVAPRVTAWIDNSTLPLVFLALEKNFDFARREVANDNKARVVKRVHSATATAQQVLESAEALWRGLAA